MQSPSDFECDADYAVQWRVEGRKVRCPIYALWDQMRRRCKDEAMKSRSPTYQGVSCSTEWLRFSAFNKWVLLQPWQGMALDKDILIAGNKTYSPEACAFVPSRVNTLFTSRPPSKKGLPLGVRMSNNGPSSAKPFEAMVNQGTGKSVFIGNFQTPIEAHAAYLLAKAEVILDVVDWWRTDFSVKYSFQVRVANAMSLRANALIDASRSSKQVLSI